jgi:hypothetical protein
MPTLINMFIAELVLFKSKEGRPAYDFGEVDFHAYYEVCAPMIIVFGIRKFHGKTLRLNYEQTKKDKLTYTEAKTNTLLAQVDADGTLLGARIHLEDETVFADFDKKRLIRTVRGNVKVQYELIETLPRPAIALPVPDKVHQVVALKKAK